jgi:hypothetical protein
MANPLAIAASREKVKRAEKHIRDLDVLLSTLANLYSLAVEQDSRQKISFLKFDIQTSPQELIDCALVIGDALHNLRSALDVLYYGQVVGQTRYTRFPILDTREKLVVTLENALEKKQITPEIYSLILDTVQPYEAGNYPLWFLDKLNIRDKHQLLIPVEKLMRFDNIRLEDDKQMPVSARQFYLMEDSSRMRIIDSESRNITVKDKGKATTAIFFSVAGSFIQDQTVIPTLNGIAEEVTRTIEAFKTLLVS